MNEVPKCSICGGPLADDDATWKLGNNARPINNGRCCNACDNEIVIPARIAIARRQAKTEGA